jgi:hypothetical protein
VRCRSFAQVISEFPRGPPLAVQIISTPFEVAALRPPILYELGLFAKATRPDQAKQLYQGNPNG